MPESTFPHWSNIHTLVFDFDGVFTDNKVIVDQYGNESVICDRGDGLAFDLLRHFVHEWKWPLKYFILSKEKNPVVSARARKLKVDCIQGVDNKSRYLDEYSKKYFSDTLNPFKGIVYFGNDLNDLPAMQLVGFSVAPADAHPIVRRYANVTMPQYGGSGFIRASIEKILMIDQSKIDDIIEIF